MARFDVYTVDVLRTRVVVPLRPSSNAPKPARDFNLVFDIGGRPHVILTQFIATVPVNELRGPSMSLMNRSDDIVRAVDTLLVGF